MPQIDRLVHEPVRLRVLTLLSALKEAEFSFVLRALALTNGNLSVHMRKLEDVGYVSMTKSFVGRIPKTMFRITKQGRQALDDYWRALDDIRAGDA
ncbi:MAG TPA: transcriptional regulator [Armatimonadota bacterium]|nr:transcriptional regulator [Armatimonadota bacterium]